MSPHSFLLTTFCLFLIIWGPFPSLSHQTVRRLVGESATLSCNCRDEYIVLCFWYKAELGLKPVKMSSFYKHNSEGKFEDIFKGSKRFTLDNFNNSNNLRITELQTADAAAYFCMRSNLYSLEFAESFTLDVKGEGLGLKTSVVEVMPEDSSFEERPLDCSFSNEVCRGQDRLHWFKPSEESAAGVLYSQGGGDSDQCERNIVSSTNSCVYNLPVFDENVTGDWSRCAVASCGRVLFGSKRDPSSEDKDAASVLVFVLSGALVVAVILCALLALSTYKIKKRSQPPETTANEEDIHYAALRHHSSNRSRRPAPDTSSECVYSAVRL